MKKVVLVTGASSGIGKAAALELSRCGCTVYAAARRVGEMEDLLQHGINIMALDVTDEKSMVDCVSRIVVNEGRVDVLVNNAGYGSYGALEDVPIDEARRQFEVNLFGLARMTQLVLPSMRRNKSGRIINISSMGAKIYTPFGSWYHSTKFALEGLSDSLRLELAPFGIDVVLVEPGCIKTQWEGIAMDNLTKNSAKGAYVDRAKRFADNMSKLYSGNITAPEKVAQTIAKAAMAHRPKTRYVVGYLARPVIFMRWLLGDRAFDRLVRFVV